MGKGRKTWESAVFRDMWRGLISGKRPTLTERGFVVEEMDASQINDDEDDDEFCSCQISVWHIQFVDVRRLWRLDDIRL